jgi:transcriptional regulator
MYIPRPFQIGSDEAKDLLASFDVGQLVTSTEQGPLATLVPWVIYLENNCLVGHISRANTQWKTPWLGDALVIVDGINGYVRPNWYETKKETGKVVPTWDYVVIQIRGELVIHEDLAWIKNAVERLTNRHEEQREKPWQVDDAPIDYVEAQLNAIVGIEFKIKSIEAAVKMSQNKKEADFHGVVAGFKSEGKDELSDWVKRSIQK